MYNLVFAHQSMAQSNMQSIDENVKMSDGKSETITRDEAVRPMQAKQLFPKKKEIHSLS